MLVADLPPGRCSGTTRCIGPGSPLPLHIGRHAARPATGVAAVAKRSTYGSTGAHGGGYDELVSTPAQAGTNAQSAYVLVEDADAHYAGAKAAGAEMVLDIQD